MNSQKEIIRFNNKKPIYNQRSQDFHIQHSPKNKPEDGKPIYIYNIKLQIFLVRLNILPIMMKTKLHFREKREILQLQEQKKIIIRKLKLKILKK